MKVLCWMFLVTSVGTLVWNIFILAMGESIWQATAVTILWGFAVGHWFACNFTPDGKFRRIRGR